MTSRLFKNAQKRYGKQLSMFVVRECDHMPRHHLNIITEKPNNFKLNFLIHIVKSRWQKIKFGYNESTLD